MTFFRIEIPIDLEGLAVAQDALEEWATASGVPPPAALRLRLVVEELVANLVEHAAWPGDPVPAWLEVAWRPGSLAAVLEDQSAPFDSAGAREVAAPRLDQDRVGGLGLGLVRKMTSALRHSAPEGGGNRVEFSVRLG
ncbi:ATP-binding protein [Falsiroseomonas sp. E2-1-a20]|uniref:ATP-binding protein n=1 Tax=Falsiroseomonas sp. E2-1-a20 TaxID=3239300 RepID=UPI003F2DE8F1